MNFKIRPMTVDDFTACVNLVDEFYDESLSNLGKLDVDCLYKAFMGSYKTSFVATYRNKVIGMLAGELSDNTITGEKVYHEIVWFATKKYRSCGIRLLKHVEQYCIDNDIPCMVIGYMANLNATKMDRFFSRTGYIFLEKQFMKRLFNDETL